MARSIPLNLLTLYADLLQGLPDSAPASISRRRIGNSVQLYAVHPGGRQEYLGPAGDVEAQGKAQSYRSAALRARGRRKTITALKAAGVPAPDVATGRVIEAIANAGLFEKGAVLVGTAAFQLYPLPVGAFLSSGALMTRDVDIAVSRVVVAGIRNVLTLQEILRAADPSFAPKFHRDQKPPCSWVSESGFIVDVLTTAGRSTAAVNLKALEAGALPLKFLDYLIETPMPVAALVGPGVRVLTPLPVRYALHKLIIAGLRPAGERSKSEKDIFQAAELLDALRRNDPQMVDEAIEEAMDRGPAWRKSIKAGLQRVATVALSGR